MAAAFSRSPSFEHNAQATLAVIAEPDMPRELDGAIRQLLCECFPADRAAFAHCRAWHASWPAYTVVAHSQDLLVGHVGMVIRQIAVGASSVCVAGVQNFCVVPARRGSGLAKQLLERALWESRRRGVVYGLLFCVPELERLYARWGWHSIDGPFTMRDELGQSAPLPAKNIAMVIELSTSRFPAGAVDLQGRDW